MYYKINYLDLLEWRSYSPSMNSIALPILMSGFLSQAGLIIAVGAQNTFIIRQGIARSHVPQILMICIAADVLMIALGTQGMGQAVQSHPMVLKSLTWCGAGVLLMYGIFGFRRAWIQCRAMWLQRRAPEGEQTLAASSDYAMVKPAQTSLKKSILSCLGFTFLNPSVYLDSIVLLGSIAATYGTDMKWSFATGAMLCSVVWFLLLGFISSKMAKLFNSRIAWVALDVTIGVVMVLLSVHLVMQ